MTVPQGQAEIDGATNVGRNDLMLVGKTEEIHCLQICRLPVVGTLSDTASLDSTWHGGRATYRAQRTLGDTEALRLDQLCACLGCKQEMQASRKMKARIKGKSSHEEPMEDANCARDARASRAMWSTPSVAESLTCLELDSLPTTPLANGTSAKFQLWQQKKTCVSCTKEEPARRGHAAR